MKPSLRGRSTEPARRSRFCSASWIHCPTFAARSGSSLHRRVPVPQQQSRWTRLRHERSMYRLPSRRRRPIPCRPRLGQWFGPRRRSATTSSSPSAKKRTAGSAASRPCCAARSPTATPGVIFDRALAALLEKVEKAKLGAISPRSESSIRSGTDDPDARRSRHIPSEVKRAVSKRDADQCAFVAPDGRRCTQRAFLEFHHVQPFAKQGPATVENISLRCRRHNQFEAELVFGPHAASRVGEPRASYVANRRPWTQEREHLPGVP